ncbi:dGTP triphosphohydrolase [Vibrio antiquarius]|uniref:dGTP triphosphohydrolase n=1 Tax=Vibrio antiquarius (strain Ex25) TaxID=150340 RepID=UPI00265AC731|nr:dNTP triphosphohydrolase [Vibrio antiquarius]MCR9845939.1 dNTP triphosphohydrolase [Vibrio antiquarius]MCR9911417.1 dNTP triphosphohydrolase [Vibrio antiquarius]
MSWNKFFHNGRRKDKSEGNKTFGTDAWGVLGVENSREEIERDYDRILFLALTRRLSDKTQVFPLEQNDSVRTRLTHSHEVANLARSIGTQLAYEHTGLFDDDSSERQWSITRVLPSLLAGIGLAHDLGNPPFGHQGESAIQDWFKNKSLDIFPHEGGKIPNEYNDFIQFDGNSQTIRLLTQLQILNDKFGINLTYGMLAAMLKYPQSSKYVADRKEAIAAWAEEESQGPSPKKPTWKKHGYFYSESEIIKDVWEETGLKEGVRHPLTYVMEACDDIAYSVLDAEDIVKKGLASYHDLINHLTYYISDDCAKARIKKDKSDLSDDEVDTLVHELKPRFDVIQATIDASKSKHNKFSNPSLGLTPAELNDMSMQMFRVYAIGNLVQHTTQAFVDNFDGLCPNENPHKDLMSLSIASELCDALKDFDLKWGYKNKSVLKLELEGHGYIQGLMDMLWVGIHGKLDSDDPKDSSTPFGKYAYGRISENYRRVFEDEDNDLPDAYKEAQLLTDAISGMTDSYLIDLHDELKQLHRNFSG